MAGFQWEPLASQNSSLRLLKIEPADANEPVKCTLRNVDSPKTYVCLSYQCGPEHPQKEVLINGEPVFIRLNLWNFLVTSRRYGLDVWLWIDALSINQNDLREKSAQVARMGQIYQSAQRTIVWTGLSDEYALNLLKLQDFLEGRQPDERHVPKQVWKRFCSAYSETRTRENTTNNAVVKSKYIANEVFKEGAAASNKHLKDEDVQVLQRYLSMDPALEAAAWSGYFGRAWIVQELFLSRQSEFITPSRPVRVSLMLLYLSDWLWVRAGENYPKLGGFNNDLKHDDLIAKWKEFGQLSREFLIRQNITLEPSEDESEPLEQGTIGDALRLVEQRNCQDIRDHVYSVIWLVKGWGGNFPVDYTASVERIFWQVIDFHERRRASKQEQRMSISGLVRGLFDSLRLKPPHVFELEKLEQVKQHISRSSGVEERLHWLDHFMPAHMAIGRAPMPSDKAIALPVYTVDEVEIFVWPVDCIGGTWKITHRDDELERHIVQLKSPHEMMPSCNNYGTSFLRP